MPDRLSYDEAMLYAARTLKIKDPDIKQGMVETIDISTSAGNLKKPWGVEGGFAVVYKFRTQSGQMKAMRCFRVPMHPDTRSRYEKMSDYFCQHVPNITIDFRYYEDGILVKESIQSAHKITCPVIVMEWVEGMMLLEKVDQLCKQKDTHTLAELAEQWLQLMKTMWKANLAHGDLAGVNVMVRPDGQLVLIDYDGVYIPEFQGMQQIVLGQQGYQHPQVTLRQFNEYMDDFSALVIYLSLLALQNRPELWQKYVKRNVKGQLDGTMLFTKDDFDNPNTSPIFNDLHKSINQRVRDLTRALHEACLQPIVEIRFPKEIADPDYAKELALQRLKEAIQQNDEDQIIKEWDLLEGYPYAQQYKPRVSEAKKHKAVLNTLNDALASRDVNNIAVVANLEGLSELTIGVTERQVLSLAKSFMEAIRNDDDNQMLNYWQKIEQLPLQGQLLVNSQQRQRLDLAEKRKTILTRFRRACYQCQNRKARIILSAYSPILDGSPNLGKQERELVKAARSYIDMIGKVRRALLMNNGHGDVVQFAAVYDEELDQRFDDFLPKERRQIEVLKKYGKLNRALAGKVSRLALATARDIENQTSTPIFDRRLSEARANYMRTIEVRDLLVQVQRGQAYAFWKWPGDDLIERARLVWRTDRWPLHPQTADPGRQEQLIIRSVYEQYSGFSFFIGGTRQLYVQVFFVIKDYDEQTHEQRWVYSSGNEPTSRWSGQVSS